MTFPLDFPELNDFGAGFLGQKQTFEKSVSVDTIPNFRRLDPDHGDYALGKGKSADRPDQRPRVGYQHSVLSALHSTRNRFTPGFEIMFDQAGGSGRPRSRDQQANRGCLVSRSSTRSMKGNKPSWRNIE
jgi:hypothetical protein